MSAVDPAALDLLREEVESLKNSAVGQETRLVQVLTNLYLAIWGPQTWPLTRRVEAVAAFIRYFSAGRPIIIMSLGLGGLLALHASFMLADQNRKLDLQNYLSSISSELAEAQRNSQFVQLIAPLVDDLRAVAQAQDAKGIESSTGREVVAIDSALVTME